MANISLHSVKRDETQNRTLAAQQVRADAVFSVLKQSYTIKKYKRFCARTRELKLVALNVIWRILLCHRACLSTRGTLKKQELQLLMGTV
jgi:hypothetical protein